MSNTISPLDGRYHSKTKELCGFFSEEAFFKYRLFVELKYFLQLIDYLDELNDLNKDDVHDKLIYYYHNFSTKDYDTIKKCEYDTNHDVKALEYYIQTIFLNEGLYEYIPFIHFGLTSQDVNTSANVLSLKDSINKIVTPSLNKIVEILELYTFDMSKHVMLSFTHGQPAVPTTMGKELNVYNYRLSVQLDNLNHAVYSTKFGGAIGNFNAHHLAYPNIDWNDFADKFVEKELDLRRETHTTQISNYDNICNILNQIKCINNIINDLNIDCWLYISKGYLKQRINTNETGSSTMPHKVNPINFENSEGNICIANSLIEGITRKLPISRLQRDLTDSTILRNIGCVIGYSLLSYKSTLEGLQKIQVDHNVINSELHNNSIVLSEGIQTVMRKHKIKDSYEKLKQFTRLDKEIKSDDIHSFINNLNDEIQNDLVNLTVENYIGYSDISNSVLTRKTP